MGTGTGMGKGMGRGRGGGRSYRPTLKTSRICFLDDNAYIFLVCIQRRCIVGKPVKQSIPYLNLGRIAGIWGAVLFQKL